MALTTDGINALRSYTDKVTPGIDPPKGTIRAAVALTPAQRDRLSELLSTFWGRDYPCPLTLDLKPQHGFQSRVIKDKFKVDDFIEWLTLGCSDVAAVSQDHLGRPNLAVLAVKDHRSVAYDVLVPIRSNQDGYVYVDDVIPKGLKGKP